MFEPLALLVLAVLVVLALPAVWLLCQVALDLPVFGLAMATGCGVAVYLIEPHLGPSVVDATLALMALTGGVIALATIAGGWRWMSRPPAPAELPTARTLR